MSDLNKLNDQELESVSGGVTEDEALLKALKHAGVNADPKNLRKKVELDFEHGVRVYEIKFYYNGMEYEYDVDAATGNILKAERDFD